MSELTKDDGSPENLAAKDHAVSGEEGKVQTDVSDVFADGEKMGMPVFNVDKDSFYQNMNFGRKRLRFPTGSPTQAYMQKTKYNKPFWIAHTEPNGQKWTRKVK